MATLIAALRSAGAHGKLRAHFAGKFRTFKQAADEEMLRQRSEALLQSLDKRVPLDAGIGSQVEEETYRGHDFANAEGMAAMSGLMIAKGLSAFVLVASTCAFAMNQEGHDDWMSDLPAAAIFAEALPEARPLPTRRCPVTAKRLASNAYEQVPLRRHGCPREPIVSKAGEGKGTLP